MSIITRSRSLCVLIITGAILVASGCTGREIQAVEASSVSRPPAVAQQPAETSVEAFLHFAYALHNEPFLVCTRAHESDTAGGYQAYNPAGPYYGAYQFLQGTWNFAAAHYGAPQYSGWNPMYVPGFWQDVVAWNYYLAVGNGPWAGRC